MDGVRRLPPSTGPISASTLLPFIVFFFNFLLFSGKIPSIFAQASISGTGSSYLQIGSVLNPASPPFNSTTTSSSSNATAYKFILSFISTSSDSSQQQQQSDLDRFYLAISFVADGGQILWPPVWVANRNSPVSSAANLTFSSSGDLLLYDVGAHSVVWSSGTAHLGATRLQLLDNGNLALLSDASTTEVGDSVVIWQSFDHPTDTLLPGQPFTVATDPLISARQSSSESGGSRNFSIGRYSLSFADTSANASQLQLSYVGAEDPLLDSLQSRIYWSKAIPSTTEEQSSMPAVFSFDRMGVLSLQQNQDQVYWMQNASDYGSSTSTERRLTLDADGNLRMYSWDVMTSQWRVVLLVINDVCFTVPNVCGAFGICVYQPRPTCVCAPGFTPSTDPTLLSGGCARNPEYPIHGCGNFRFLELQHIDFPFNDINHDPITGISQDACLDLCSQSCADGGCLAAVYNTDNKCWLKYALQNGVSKLTHHTFVKLSSSDPIFSSSAASVGVYTNADSVTQPDFNASLWLPQSIAAGPAGGGAESRIDNDRSHQRNLLILLIALLSTIALLWIVSGSSQFLLIATYRAKLDAYRKLHGDLEDLSGSPVVFTYKELEAATEDFTEMLGEGAFGKVYKGRLPKDGRAVAVKKLKEGDVLQKYEEKQFRSEIVTIGRIHHVNLVRLIGFCAEGSHRLLVYEYLPNGSLADALFSDGAAARSLGGAVSGAAAAAAPRSLDWPARFQICVRVAKAIKYLHEDCADCILHCDIKPQNILLDDGYCAKVADFGLAYLYSRDDTVIKMTNMRGTRGYMAPEWVSGLPITSKCDVYSYGMLAMEILSGRRNFMYSESAMVHSDEDYWCFPVWVYGRTVREAIDPKLLLSKEVSEERCRNGDEDGHERTESASCADSGGDAVDWEEAERVLKVALACIQVDIHARPSMATVVRMLEGNLPLPEVLQPPLFLFTMMPSDSGSKNPFAG